MLIGGVLYVDLTHDAGGFYNQTGLTTFELPPETRKVILKARSTQESEGLQLYIGTEVPPITYDIVTGVLTIPSVKVGTATYINVTLNNIGSYAFALQTATAQAPPVPALATYDADTGILTLPSVKVGGSTYDVTLQNVGSYTFTLLSATAQP